MRCKSIVLLLSMAMAAAAVAQEAGPTLKPNYRKIARVVARPSSPFFADSLEARFARCDTSLTIDHFRCLYYSTADSLALTHAHQRYLLLASRLGSGHRRVGEAWWRYQMLTSAVWSTGNGLKSKPLHVRSEADARVAAEGYDDLLWFKIRCRKKFPVQGKP